MIALLHAATHQPCCDVQLGNSFPTRLPWMKAPGFTAVARGRRERALCLSGVSFITVTLRVGHSQSGDQRGLNLGHCRLGISRGSGGSFGEAGAFLMSPDNTKVTETQSPFPDLVI